MSDCLYFLRYWMICVLQLFANQVVTSKILKLTLSLLSSRFYTWPISISWERKELLRWNKKHFSSFLKGFYLPKIVSDLRVRLKNVCILELWWVHLRSRIISFFVFNTYHQYRFFITWLTRFLIYLLTFYFQTSYLLNL